MYAQEWKNLFKPGEVLTTERKQNKFTIEKVTDDHLLVSIEGPKRIRHASLDYRRLDEIYRRRNEVEPTSIRPSVKKIWASARPARLPHDPTNESQFWAVVCARVRRESQGVNRKVGPQEETRGKSEQRNIRGQGFEDDPRVRRAVERRAMKVARKRYPDFEDVSASRPFDLSGKIAGEEVHVEVKGSRSVVDDVHVTVGEVRAARDARWRTDLVVVENIEIEQKPAGPVGRGGQVRVFERWKPREEDLEAIAYRCRLPAIR